MSSPSDYHFHDCVVCCLNLVCTAVSWLMLNSNWIISEEEPEEKNLAPIEVVYVGGGTGKSPMSSLKGMHILLWTFTVFSNASRFWWYIWIIFCNYSIIFVILHMTVCEAYLQLKYLFEVVSDLRVEWTEITTTWNLVYFIYSAISLGGWWQASQWFFKTCIKQKCWW